MDITKARKLNSEDLKKEIGKVEHNVVQVRSEVAMHKLKNHRKLRAVKKYLARLLTIKMEQSMVQESEQTKEDK